MDLEEVWIDRQEAILIAYSHKKKLTPQFGGLEAYFPFKEAC